MCEMPEENIILYAVGSLDRAELIAVREHLATGCPQCAGHLASAEATLGLVALSAMEDQPRVPSSAKAKLDRLISGESQEQVGAGERAGLRIDGATVAPARRKVIWWPAAMAAVLAAAITSGILLPELSKQTKEMEGVKSEIAAVRGAKELADQQLADAIKTRDALTAERNSGAAQLASAEKAKHELEQMLHSSQLVTLNLKGTDGDAEAKGMLLVDLQNGIWKFFATNLKPMPNRQFEFWLITADGQKVPMGSFVTAENGEGTLGDKVPSPLPKLAMAAVSDEPMGSQPTAPTGTLHVMGEFR